MNLMLAVFGIGTAELLIIGLVCCLLVLPIAIALVVLAVVAGKNRSEHL